MFQDVDETLRAVLQADVPIKRNEVDISFDRPTREWSNRLTRPTLNVFLYDIKERIDLRNDVPTITRDVDGRAVRQMPPRRVELSYLLSAWTTETDDEHRILARVLASMYRQTNISPENFKGDLKGVNLPVVTHIPAPADASRPSEVWSGVSNDLHASLTWVWTVPLDVFRPSTGPLVRTAEIGVRPIAEPADLVFLQVGGLVHRKGYPLAGVPGVKVTVLGTAFEAVSDADGRFHFMNLPAGTYKWRVEAPGSKAREHSVAVPSPNYDVEV
jgi:hypothetical protein